MTDLASFLSQSEHLFAAGGAKSFLSAKLFETLMRKMGVYVSSYSTDYLDDAVNYFKKDDLLTYSFQQVAIPLTFAKSPI